MPAPSTRQVFGFGTPLGSGGNAYTFPWVQRPDVASVQPAPQVQTGISGVTSQAAPPAATDYAQQFAQMTLKPFSLTDNFKAPVDKIGDFLANPNKYANTGGSGGGSYAGGSGRYSGGGGTDSSGGLPPLGSVDSSAGAVSAAARYEGVPYVWGGKNERGMDCSGLTALTARDLGVKIPEGASNQWDYFSGNHLTVKPKDVKPGDYIYFHTSGGSGWHTGVYAGHGMMWNAPHTGAKVRLDSISGRDIVGYGRLPGGVGNRQPKPKPTSDGLPVVPAGAQVSPAVQALLHPTAPHWSQLPTFGDFSASNGTSVDELNRVGSVPWLKQALAQSALSEITPGAPTATNPNPNDVSTRFVKIDFSGPSGERSMYAPEAAIQAAITKGGTATIPFYDAMNTAAPASYMTTAAQLQAMLGGKSLSSVVPPNPDEAAVGTPAWLLRQAMLLKTRSKTKGKVTHRSSDNVSARSQAEHQGRTSSSSSTLHHRSPKDTVKQRKKMKKMGIPERTAHNVPEY